MAKLKRPSMLMFINVTPAAETKDYRLCGVYSDDLSLAYNPVTEESQDVTDVASSTDVTGYALNIPVTTKVVAAHGQKGFVLSDYINGLRKGLATAGEAETEVLIVDTYTAGTTQGTFVAQEFVGVIAIDTYGGPANESLGLDYTVYINGSPVNGTVVVSTDTVGDKTAVFTKTV